MTERPTLDAALAAWATTEPEGAGDQAALARILGHAETIATQPAPARAAPRPGPRWMLGGALAASLAIALLFAPRQGTAPGTDQVVVAQAGGGDGGAVMLAEADSDTRAAFALLYTPTVEEEYQL
jgi:hypothetical protein